MSNQEQLNNKGIESNIQAHSANKDKQEGKRIIIQTPINSEPLAIILKEEGIDYIV